MHNNPTKVNLESTQPQVERISRLVIGVIGGILIVLLMVALISLPNHAHKKQPDAPELSNTKASKEDQAWYTNKSNALNKSASKNADIPSDILSSHVEVKTQSTLEKIKQDDYVKALNAPLSPSDMSSELMPTTHDNSALNAELSTSQRKLPLSEEQIAKLSNDFGLVDPNLHAEKHQFIEIVARKTDKDYLNETLKNPVSPYEIQAGNIIPAILSGGINSDLPGQVLAIVRQNVYDSVKGRYLLIPQGSKLLMMYDSHIAFGQERVLPAVKRIIFPNGQSMDLEGMPASDKSGYAGFKDEVDNHYGKIYGAALVMGGIAAAFQVSQPQQNSSLVNPSNAQAAAGAMGQQLAQVTTATVSKNLNIQPTLKIRPGYKFNVNVTADMIFPNPYLN